MSRPKTIVVIPARMGSSRYPGKPLARILDLPMIEHVRRRVLLCKDIDGVIVATCDDEIFRAVREFGGTAVMTSDKHERCTDRIAEAACGLDAEVVVNIQGDEPCVLPRCVSDVARPIQERPDIQCTCLIYPVDLYDDLANPNMVKAVLSKSGSIMYLGRNPIPSQRKGENPQLYKQSGIMAYRKEFLLDFTKMPQTPLERVESCDMMRILENDIRIQGIVTNYETPGVDVPSDIVKVESLIKSDSDQACLYETILQM